MRRFVPFTVIAAAALSACSTILPAGRGPLSPAGQTLRVIAANGAESRMRFGSDGRVTATFGDRAIQGEWNVQQEGLCFRWTGAEIECWPYVEPFRRGETKTVTSTRGNVVQVTAL
jgi:hypothetical protein